MSSVQVHWHISFFLWCVTSTRFTKLSVADTAHTDHFCGLLSDEEESYTLGNVISVDDTRLAATWAVLAAAGLGDDVSDRNVLEQFGDRFVCDLCCVSYPQPNRERRTGQNTVRSTHAATVA